MLTVLLLQDTKFWGKIQWKCENGKWKNYSVYMYFKWTVLI